MLLSITDRPKFGKHQSSECLAWQRVNNSAEDQRNFGKNLASFLALHLQHFVLAPDVNLKSLYLLLITS